MKTLKPLLMLTVASLAMFTVAGQASYTFVRVSKVGEEFKYKFTANLNYGDLEISIKGINRELVTRVEESGEFTILTSQSDVVVTTPDGEAPQPGESTSTTVFNADRTVKGYTIPDQTDISTSMRLALISTLQIPKEPKAVGEGWTAEIAANGEKTFPVKADYTLVAEEKIGEWNTVKLELKSTETTGALPLTCTGFVWLDTTNFVSVKEDLTFKNVSFRNAPKPVDLHMVSERAP